MIRAIITITFALCTTTSIALTTSYGFKDLEVLSTNKNFYEFFQHARDILPSKRDSKWKEMVQDTGIDYLSSVNSKTKLEEKDINLINSISLWPTLMTNEFYNKHRDKIFLKQLENCFDQNKNDCIEKAQAIANDYTHDNEFTFLLLILLTKKNTPHQVSWPFTRELVRSKYGEFYCNKEPVRSILYQELQTRVSKSDLVKSAYDRDCIKVFSKHLTEQLMSSSLLARKTAFKVLKTYDFFKEKDQGKFEVMNMIDGVDLSSKELDHTLRVLKLLSKDEPQRKIIIGLYRKLDPIPDKLFKNENSKKTQAKVRILNRYFPEILDSYTLSCLNYLEGKGNYPQGNPSPNCHKFFKIGKLLQVIPESFIKKYDKATYFIKK